MTLIASPSGATFSSCGRYRYALWRDWRRQDLERQLRPERALVFIGLNPSTADASQDDPTIRRVMGFARRLDCTSLLMLNIFALRSTDPKALYDTVDPIGPDNDAFLTAWSGAPAVAHVIAGWGVHGAFLDRGRKVGLDFAARGGGLSCLGRTKDGHPKHPLYLRADAPLERWSPS